MSLTLKTMYHNFPHLVGCITKGVIYVLCVFVFVEMPMVQVGLQVPTPLDVSSPMSYFTPFG